MDHRIKKKQEGVVLLIVLITMAVMLLGGIAIMRTTSAGAAISTNLSFRSSTTHSANIGIDHAINRIAALSAANATNVPIKDLYYPVMLPVDAKGLPIGVNWSALPVQVKASSGDEISYVIERMCQPTSLDANGPSTTNDYELNKYCISDNLGASSSGSTAAGHLTFSSFGNNSVYYRVTILSKGARGATSIIQSMLTD